MVMNMDKKVETKNLKQVAMLPGTPHEVYEMLMDSKKHAAFSQSKAKISRKVGGKFTAYDGWIEGKNIKLVKDKEIVQSWRSPEWPKGHYSTVRFILKKSGNSTKLLFSQVGIPEDDYKDISSGWKEFYWERMKEELSK